MLFNAAPKTYEVFPLYIYHIGFNPFPTYNKSAADDFENLPETNWETPFRWKYNN